jgi:hypothetical protein
MIAMADEQFSVRLRRALLAGTCGLLLGFSAIPSASAADEEDEDTFEQSIIKNILGAVGVDVGRAGIDYRERSPLVVPPSRDLPPPVATSVEQNPAWPREKQQERKRRAAAAAPKVNVRASPEEPGTSSIMTPDELRRGATPSGRITDPSQSGSVEEPNVGRPLSPKELGSNGLFGWNMFSYKPEQVPFTGEPGRSSLTQPPPGYQTPSPAAPYGVGQEAPAGWKIPTILSRPEGSANN